MAKMDLKQVTNKNLITINCDLGTKKEVIDHLVDKLYKEKKSHRKKNF